MRDLGLCDGETRTRTGDTTIFSRYVLGARRPEIPGKVALLAKSVRWTEVRSLRAFPPDSGDGWQLISFFAGAFADPVNDLLVAGPAGGNALDQSRIGAEVRRSPCPAVGVEKPSREQKRRNAALITG